MASHSAEPLAELGAAKAVGVAAGGLAPDVPLTLVAGRLLGAGEVVTGDDALILAALDPAVDLFESLDGEGVAAAFVF